MARSTLNLSAVIAVVTTAAAFGLSSANIRSDMQVLEDDDNSVIYLLPQRIYSGNTGHEPQIFCYRGKPFSLLNIFSSAQLVFSRPPTSYELFEGTNPDEVLRQWKSRLPSWLPLIAWRSESIPFTVFTNKCIGIVSRSDFSGEFRWVTINFLRVTRCLLSLLLFFHAHRIVHNRAVFYATGTSLGVIASILITVYVVSRHVLPGRRLTLVASLMAGWSFSVYILHRLWSNFYEILLSYKSYVFVYISLSASVSFLVCYWRGPPTNSRTIDVMAFLLQALALMGVYISSDAPELTIIICAVALLVYNFPPKLRARCTTWLCRRIFKPKMRMLTEEEYMRQADETTRMELEKLRKFAQSPECNAWKVMTKLKDPTRFGSFVMGESHLQDSELLEYETSGHYSDDQPRLTDDESDEADSQRNGFPSVPGNGVSSPTRSYGGSVGDTPNISTRSESSNFYRSRSPNQSNFHSSR